METPPNSKIFDTAFTGNATDTAALAKHRSIAQQPPQQPPTQPIVNFEGLTDVLKQLHPALHQPHPTFHPAQIPLPNPLRNCPPPKMTVHVFCAKFDLSPAIEAKLSRINVSGPHLLRLIDDNALRKEGELDLGELAGVRDAEERWMNEVHGPVTAVELA
jgi:hypothetical protein